MPARKILVVDDEPTNLQLINSILGRDYRLVFARSGVEALQAAEKHRPALILLDVCMPGMDGYAVCRTLKAQVDTAAIPVIFVTALSEDSEESCGFDAGAVDYITKPFSPAVVSARVRTHLSLVRANELAQSQRDAIHMLGRAGHYNDTDTGVHVWRMAAFARALAEAIGWSQEDAEQLELAAPMHDMGKIGIPHTILRKPAALDAQEWAVMKTHARIGHDILSTGEAPLFKLAAEVALRHHEKWDGSGYPDGLTGTAIPQSARIVAVADVFDALSMKRPYKPAWPLARVLDTIKDGTGKHFDPELVEALGRRVTCIVELKAEWDEREAQLAANDPSMACCA
ncbi:MAG: response regulator [Rhodocyclaceae bacterium]|nr:response regulator [Rhodocyclaceae bacterium]